MFEIIILRVTDVMLVCSCLARFIHIETVCEIVSDMALPNASRAAFAVKPLACIKDPNT